MQCKAKSKRSGERCKRHATPGMTVCNIHGGKTPVGIASPNFRTGRYSKYLPVKLAGRFEDMQHDSDLLNLQSEITLIDVLLSDNLERLQTGESADFWDAAFRHTLAARRAYKDDRYADLEQALDELEALCDGRRLHFAAEREVREKIDLRRRLTESRRKHLIEAEQVLTTEQAMLLVSGLLESVRRNVTDRDTLNAVQADFVRLVSVQKALVSDTDA